MLGAGARDVERVQRLLEDYFEKPVVLLNSARTGIFLSLLAHGLAQQDEVWVPPFLSPCVLNVIARKSVPSLSLSARTKAALVVHQWGYPQRMERVQAAIAGRDLLLVEDCAFSFASTYRSQRVGSFGHAAVFSFPKVFPTVLGGCLVTGDERILGFAREYLKEQDRFGWQAFSTFAIFPMLHTLGTRDGIWNSFIRKVNAACYELYPDVGNPNPRVCRLFPRTRALFDEAQDQRRQNLALFRQQFSGAGYDPAFETDSDVVPYVAPFFAPAEALELAAAALGKQGVETGVYHFDVERDMSASNYRKCVAVPMHQGISAERMTAIRGVLQGTMAAQGEQVLAGSAR